MARPSTYRRLRRSVLGKRSHESLELLRRLEEEGNDNPNLNLVHILLSLWQGRFATAKERYRSLSEFDRKDPRAVMLGAYLDLLDDRERDAIVKYSQHLEHPTAAKKVRWVLNRIRERPYKEVLDRYALEDFLLPLKTLFEGEPRVAIRPTTSQNLKAGSKVLAGALLVLLPVALVVVAATAFQDELQRTFRGLKDRWFAKASAPSSETANELFYLNVFNSKEREYLFRLIPEVMNARPIGDSNERSGWDYSASELEQRLDAMRFFIHQRKINSAIVVFNRMVQSSIPLRYEERFRILAESLPSPNFETFENSLRLRALLTNPYTLNVYVKWRGFFSRRNKEWFFSILEGETVTYTAKVLFAALPEGLQEREEVVFMGRSKGLRKQQLLLEALVIQPIVRP